MFSNYCSFTDKVNTQVKVKKVKGMAGIFYGVTFDNGSETQTVTINPEQFKLLNKALKNIEEVDLSA